MGMNHFHSGFGHHLNHIQSWLDLRLLQYLLNYLGLEFPPYQCLANLELRYSFGRLASFGRHPNLHHNLFHNLSLRRHRYRHLVFDMNRNHCSNYNHLIHHY